MADITFEDVIKLVDQLSPNEKSALLTYLSEASKITELTIEERKTLFESLTVDLGEVLPRYSDRRETSY